MGKNFAGFILTLILTLLILPTKAFAVDTATITVSDATAKAGETAEMVVLVQTDSGVSGTGITVIYNKNAMTLTEIRPLVSGTFLPDPEHDSFSWLKGENLTGAFELVTLCFSVDASASGDYKVEVSPIGDLAANITNQDASSVLATFVPGILRVANGQTDNIELPPLDSITHPEGEREKDSSNIGLYIVIIVAVVAGVATGAKRKKCK